MGTQYDEGPEVAPQNYPEVTQHQQQPHAGASPQYGYQQQQPYDQAPKPEVYHPDGSTTYAGTSPYAAVPASPFSQHANATADPHQQHPTTKSKSGGVCCGCSLLVVILSCIIGLLSAAVIGLAAGTGVEAGRASDANTKLAALNASMSSAAASTTTVTTAVPAATSFNDLDRGCPKDPEGVNGTDYTSFSLLGKVKFTVYCNRDAPGNSFMSLFVADMDTCMDACSSYSMYTPRFFGSGGASNQNTTCGGVSFIPLWTDKTNATAGGAPGNCYLKPTPQNYSGLGVPNIGTECHAAILT